MDTLELGCYATALLVGRRWQQSHTQMMPA